MNIFILNEKAPFPAGKGAFKYIDA